MKKSVIAILLVLCLAVSLGVTAMAADGSWTVTFTANKTMDKSYTADELKAALSDMQPGDSATLTFSLRNESTSNTTWYINNEVTDSLERSEEISSGAYTYQLAYTDPSGAIHMLYDSDEVNAEGTNQGGLSDATETLDDWAALGKINAGENATVTLKVTLDGETQANNYQDSDATIVISFAAEVEQTTTTTTTNTNVVKTGDEFNMPVMAVIAGGSGLLFLALAIWSVVARKKNKEDAAK